MAVPHKVSLQWLPVFDKYRYHPLPVHLDFLHHVFDIVFLLVFIWYWNWGPLLVILYYVIETLVLCLFTSLKWWKSKALLVEERKVSSPVLFKAIAILTLCAVVGIFSYGQITAVYDVLGIVMTLPSWNVILQDEQEFMIGVLAIVLQQTMEYYKYSKTVKNAEEELVTYIMTPVLRIFIQQFTVMLGVLTVLLVSFIDAQTSAVTIALMLGIMKLIFGQLQLVVTEHQKAKA